MKEDMPKLKHCMIEKAILSEEEEEYKEDKYIVPKFAKLKSGSVPLFTHLYSIFFNLNKMKNKYNYL